MLRVISGVGGPSLAQLICATRAFPSSDDTSTTITLALKALWVLGDAAILGQDSQFRDTTMQTVRQTMHCRPFPTDMCETVCVTPVRWLNVGVLEGFGSNRSMELGLRKEALTRPLSSTKASWTLTGCTGT